MTGWFRAPGTTEVSLQLTAGEQELSTALVHPLGGPYLAAKWTAGELVRDVWNPLLLADAPAASYSVTLLAQTPHGSVPLLDRGQVNLQARPHNFDAPTPTFAQPAELGGIISLVGYESPLILAPGASAKLTFYWQPRTTAERNYVRIIRLLDTDGRIVAQQDGPPSGVVSPATGWLANT